jgi:hypothetical protein
MNNNRTRVIQNGGNPGYRVFYLKAIDETGSNTPATPKIHRIYNNEFIVQDLGSSTNNRMWDVQAFGNSQGTGLGQVWFYGNLIRAHSTVVRDFDRIHGNNCAGDDASASESGRWVEFNNTWDQGTVAMDNVCGEAGASVGGPGEILVDRNNVYWGVSELCVDDQASEFTTIRRAFSCNASASQSPSCTNACAGTTKSNWFDDVSTTVTYYNALTLYDPQPSGNLDETGSCDPDGDGTCGVDYDGDGSNDNTWTDIVGNTVLCPQGACSQTLDIGAIQSSSDSGGSVCNNNTREGAEVCDGSDLNSQTCELQGFSCGQLACASDCTAFVTSSCVAAVSCGNGNIDTVGTCNEECDGANLGGNTCDSQGAGACGILSCTSCAFVTTACTDTCTQIIGGVTLQGVTVE